MTIINKITGSLENAVEKNRLPILLSTFLAPASGLYGAVLSIRNAFYDRLSLLSRAASRPVISIGGIRTGGTGKRRLRQ